MGLLHRLLLRQTSPSRKSQQLDGSSGSPSAPSPGSTRAPSPGSFASALSPGSASASSTPPGGRGIGAQAGEYAPLILTDLEEQPPHGEATAVQLPSRTAALLRHVKGFLRGCWVLFDPVAFHQPLRGPSALASFPQRPRRSVSVLQRLKFGVREALRGDSEDDVVLEQPYLDLFDATGKFKRQLRKGKVEESKDDRNVLSKMSLLRSDAMDEAEPIQIGGSILYDRVYITGREIMATVPFHRPADAVTWGKAAFTRFKLSPAGIFLLQRWLPLQDVGSDSLVTFCQPDFCIFSLRLCSDLGLAWSTEDPWWGFFSVTFIILPYLILWILSAPIMYKAMVRHSIPWWLAGAIWFLAGLPACVLLDVALLLAFPCSMLPAWPWLLNIQRLRLVIESLVESPCQTALQVRVFIVKVLTGRIAIKFPSTLVFSIGTSLFNFGLTLADINNLAKEQGMGFSACLHDLLMVGLGRSAPLLYVLKTQKQISYKSEGMLTEKHCRQISYTLPSSETLERVVFGHDNCDPQGAWLLLEAFMRQPKRLQEMVIEGVVTVSVKSSDSCFHMHEGFVEVINALGVDLVVGRIMRFPAVDSLTFDGQLEHLQDLNSLTLSAGEPITAANLKHLELFRQLTTLDIGNHNGFGADEAYHLRELTRLTDLRIGDYNNLTADAACHLKVLRRLTTLDIGNDNRFDADGSLHVKELTQLTNLRIGNSNDFCANAARHITALRQLTTLEIGNDTGFSADAANQLKTLTNLTDLRIGNCNDFGAGAAYHIKALTQLTSLAIGSDNDFGADAAYHLKELVHLTSLRIGDSNNFGAGAVRHITALRQLTTLSIGNWNSLGAEGCRCLTKFEQLTTLWIGEGNDVGAEGACHLAEFRPSLFERWLPWASSGTPRTERRLTSFHLGGHNGLCYTEEQELKTMVHGLKRRTANMDKRAGYEEHGAEPTGNTRFWNTCTRARQAMFDPTGINSAMRDFARMYYPRRVEDSMRKWKNDKHCKAMFATCAPLNEKIEKFWRQIAELHELTSLSMEASCFHVEKVCHLARLRQLTTLDIGSNAGFGVDGASHLKELTQLRILRIGNKNDFGPDAAEHLSELTQLTSLRIGDSNCFGADALRHITGLRHLTILDIGSRNNIGSEGCRFLKELKELTTLRIGYGNNLHRAYHHLAEMRHLTSLHIDDGNGLDIQCAQQLPALANWVIDARAQGLQDLAQLRLQNLALSRRLKSLYIGDANGIGAQGCLTIKEFKALESLTIGPYNNVGHEGASHLKELRQLTSLVIGTSNGLGAEGALHIKELRNLTDLAIGDRNILGAEGFCHVGKIRRLINLQIGSFNQLGTKGAAHLKDLRQLRTLAIGGWNLLADEGASHLVEIPRLRSLKIGRCNWLTDVGIGVLQARGFDPLEVQPQVEMADRAADID